MSPAGGSLEGLRVLDLSRVLAGPLCTQMLADHGAEVTKVEGPGGDETRTWGPPFVSETVSAYFAALNRNKQNISLDLRTSQGQEVLAQLLERSDVLVDNFKAGTLASWGFDEETLTDRYPRLIHCQITGFGTDGPMAGAPGYDAALQAYGGLMSINGEVSGPPLRVGVPIVDMVTGQLAFSGILLAAIERQRSGRGQLVDCTLLDSAISLLHPHSATSLVTGADPQRTGSAHPTIAPYDVFTAGGEPFFIGAGNDRQFHQLCDELDLSHVVDDPRFARNSDRVEHVAQLRPILSEALATREPGELGLALLQRGVPSAPVHSVTQALSDPQVMHRQMVVRQGDYAGIGIPIKLSRTPGVVAHPAHERGADTRRILSRLGYTPQQVDQLIADDVAKPADLTQTPATA